MPPKPLSPAVLSQWVQDCVKDPLQESELGGVRNPNDPHQDPELALELGEDGVPVWWSSRDPESRAWLTPNERREWFLDWLAGMLRPAQGMLLSARRSLRRQIIAQSLLLTHSHLNDTGFPTRDSS